MSSTRTRPVAIAATCLRDLDSYQRAFALCVAELPPEAFNEFLCDVERAERETAATVVRH